MQRFHVAMVAIFLLVACGDDAEQNGTTPDQGDAPDALADVSTAEDSGSTLDIDVCEATMTWSSGRVSPGEGLDHHATFITTRGDVARLHVVGGNDYTQLWSDHRVADLGEGGALGTWETGVALPRELSGQSVAQVGDETYLLSGRDAGGMRREVLRAEFSEDGAISGWREETSVPEARFHGSAAVNGRHIYVTGGVDMAGEAQRTVFHAEVAEDGTLGAWEASELPGPRSHHSSFAYEDHLYLVLGFEGNPFQDATTPLTTILRAPLTEDGSVGAWEVALDLGEDAKLSTHATTRVEGCVVIVGGLAEEAFGYRYSDDVWRLDLTQSPLQMPQREAGALTTGRSHMHQAPYHRGRFYVVGGSQGLQDVISTVEIGALEGAP